MKKEQQLALVLWPGGTSWISRPDLWIICEVCFMRGNYEQN
jgi:hypothetical protein